MLYRYRFTESLIAVALFAAVFLYFLFFCRFQMIYHEQQQMFHYHVEYLNRWMIDPAGLALYVKCFLLQFFYYPWLGAFIFTWLVLSIFIAGSSIFRYCGVSGRFNILLLFPVVAYCIMMYDYQFDLLWLLSFVCALFFFARYIRIPKPSLRYFVGCIGLIMLYFFSPMSTFLAGILMILHEFLLPAGKQKYMLSTVYLLLVGLFPLFTRELIYTAPLSETFLTGFPYKATGVTIRLTVFAWFFVPAVLLLIRLCPDGVLEKTKSLRLRLLTIIVLIAFTVAGAFRVADQRVVLMLRINYEISRENWTEVLRISKMYPTSNRLVSFYTNIALHKTGQMLNSFFDYSQIGHTGLFMEWQRDYLTAMAGSEVFYRLGFINEANRWAFEALTASNSGENPLLFKRLIKTAIINEYFSVAAKYLHIMQSTLFYRKWADEHLALLSDQEQIANLPWISEKRSQWVKNDFLSGRVPPDNLPLFFIENPDNKMAFEYLMMFYLLTKNVDEFMNYLGLIVNFDYTSMPTIFEEAVLVYLNMHDADRESYQKYPIKKETFQRFYDYSELFQKHSKNPQLQKRELYQKFGNTYWYFFHFYHPTTK